MDQQRRDLKSILLMLGSFTRQDFGQQISQPNFSHELGLHVEVPPFRGGVQPSFFILT